MRGIHAIQEESELLASEKGSIIPLYIGSAPYWQLNNANWENVAGNAYLIHSIADAREKIGFMANTNGKWDKKVSLCEPVFAHFGGVSSIGPIIVLVNDIEIVKEESITKNVSFMNGIASIDVAGLAILSSFHIAEKVKGVDYSVKYDDNGKSLIIYDLSSIGQSIEVTYDVISNVHDLAMKSSTFEKIDFLEQTVGQVPTVLAAPGWENELLDGVGSKSVSDKLKEISEDTVNSHWYTQSYVQLVSNNRDDVATEKANKKYTSPKVKCMWPFVKKDHVIYSLVVMFILAKMKVDIANDNIPYESASNEQLNIDCLCDKDGTLIWQKESDANYLNEIGIATCNFAGGAWRTWGVCMSNYLESNKDHILPEYLNDVAVQMRDYVCNDFQAENYEHIDKPIPTRKAKEIVDDYQVVLNTLVNIGALLFGEITFNSKDNPIGNLASGDFVFDIAETNTPPGKSITAKVKYSASGLSAYNYDDKEGEE